MVKLPQIYFYEKNRIVFDSFAFRSECTIVFGL
jgi:hypothetical protein